MREHGHLRGTGPWWDWEIAVVLWWAFVIMTAVTALGVVAGITLNR